MKMQQFLNLKKRLSIIVLGSVFALSVSAASSLESITNTIGLPVITNHQSDADHDGVIDSKDQCTGTSQGRFVDNSGCEYDTDADGVKNSIDKCPQTPLGLRVKNNGCL